MLSLNLPVGRKLHTFINGFYNFIQATFVTLFRGCKINYLSSIDTSLNVHFIFLTIHYSK